MRWLTAAMLVVCIVVVLTSTSPQELNHAQAQEGFPKVPKWEYKILDMTAGADADQLNSLGAEGWELVSSASLSPPRNGIGKTFLYFKRERP